MTNTRADGDRREVLARRLGMAAAPRLLLTITRVSSSTSFRLWGRMNGQTSSFSSGRCGCSLCDMLRVACSDRHSPGGMLRSACSGRHVPNRCEGRTKVDVRSGGRRVRVRGRRRLELRPPRGNRTVFSKKKANKIRQQRSPFRPGNHTGPRGHRPPPSDPSDATAFNEPELLRASGLVSAAKITLPARP